MGGRRWTPAEDERLENLYGQVDIKAICIQLNRTKYSILHRVDELEITNSKCDLSPKEVANMFGVSIHTVIKWINLHGLPHKRINMAEGKSKGTINIKLNDLIKWLEYNQSRYHTRKLEYRALGVEPDWLKEKRKYDLEHPKFKNRKPWDDQEKELLMKLYRQGLTYETISERMDRSKHSVYDMTQKILGKKE